MSPNKSEKAYAYAMGVGALLIWSGTSIANKVAVHYLDGFSTGILRTFLVGILALALCVIVRPKLPNGYRQYSLLLMVSAFNFVIWPILASVGIEFTTAGHAAVIMAMIPIFTVLISAMVSRNIPAVGWWLGAGVAFFASET